MIQPPPLLCQPRLGLIFSGSSPSLSFLGLLDISFKQILLEDSKLEQSNIVQSVHTQQRLTNENAKSGSILYSIGKYSGNILDTLGTFVLYSISTFEVHSKYSNYIFFEFLNARTVFREHSSCIRIHHSRHLPTIDFRRYSSSNRTALIRHLKCILNIMTTF